MKELINSEILLHPHDHKNKEDWRRIFQFLERNLDFSKIKSFLDLGSGMGNLGYFILKMNPSCQVFCEDINQSYLTEIKKREPKIQTLLHDINQPLPFESNNFDLVSCIGTLHYSYVKNPEEVLKEMVRVSKKYILVDFLSSLSPYIFLRKVLSPKFSPRRYNPLQIENLFRKYNLKKIDVIGTRIPFPRLFPFLGRIVLFLLKK